MSSNLDINFNIIEPEAVAITRDPDPIIGIYKKNDIKGKDEEVLNLSLTPSKENSKKIIKKVLLIFFSLLIVLFFLIIKFKKPISENTIIPTQITISPTLIPTLNITPTSIPTKEWSRLTMRIENGTTQNGLAAKTASIFKTNGIGQVEIGNANNTSYISNKLIFKDNSLKESYQDRFKNMVKINDDNISVDNSILFDVVFITGTN
ncbi:MAG: LytR C-terminal domain-containing protein [Candidatus Shapirobacteria bacterium]|nr:LytR C-terminal domain-containing protein [Candidatus Shapirobacteria bacterium]